MRNVRLERVSRCGVCGGEDLVPLATASYVSACQSCGYMFHDPRPAEESIAAYYSETGKYDHWLDGLEGREAMWHRRLDQVRRHVRGGRLLDVGAGIGHFLHVARATFEVHGTEVSQEAVRIAQERFGVDLICGPVDEARLPGDGYDVVTLFHVLEHVVDPLGTLRECWSLTRPGGWLFIAVPNDGPLAWFKARHGTRRTLWRVVTGRARRVTYDPSWPLPAIDLENAGPEAEIHLSHFEPGSLCTLIRAAGYEVVRVGVDPYFASTGRRGRRDRLDLRLWTAVHALTGVHAYEAVLVAARKPLINA